MKPVHNLSASLAVVVLFSFIGCEPELLQYSPETIQTSQKHGELLSASSINEFKDVPLLEVDLPPNLQDRDTNLSSLSDSVSAHNGEVLIGLKAPDSKRLIESDGIREALPAKEFQKGVEFLESEEIEIIEIYSFGIVRATIDPMLVNKLSEHDRIDFIEPLQKPVYFGIGAKRNRSIFRLPVSPPQSTPWGIEMVRAPSAWTIADGSGTDVMVIDTGINDHQDLPNPPGTNCTGSGCNDNGPHGTMVAGFLMGKSHDVGVAPGIADAEAHSHGTIYSTPEWGLDHAANTGIDVVNMSFGYEDYSASLATAVSYAWNNGVLMVASAGNVPLPPIWSISPGDPVYPAAYSTVIGVSGVKENGLFADSSPCQSNGTTGSSNYGSHVSIAAPFWGITTSHQGGQLYTDESEGICGTSFSAPHVAGAAALLFEENPSWSNSQVRQRLQNSANHPFDDTQTDNYYGNGVLDAAAAVGLNLPIAPDISGPTFLQVNQPGNYDATVNGGVGPYQYQWQIDYNMGIGPWQNVGSNNPFYVHTSYTDDDFALRLVVTDADNDIGISIQYHVTVSW